mmetsp:Transcript_53444/g.134320  ORF Transcript_53444/g.134320 Transcript_53444/m.134320 type:complete len:209 (-) Transcript_53444:464-1090(-)
MRVAMLAILAWMVPYSLSFLPNCVRCVACAVARIKSSFMVPLRAATIPNLPLFRICIATLNPPPTSPSTFSTGIFTFSKNTSAVLDTLIPILFSGGPFVTPPKPRSTMKAVTLSFISPVFSSLTLVCANTVKISAMPPLLIQILLPFKTQCFPSSDSTARDWMELASEPELGSVRQNAAIRSPVAREGRYFSFCCSLPTSKIPLNPID